MTTTTLPFIKNDWTISLSDIPDYPDFKGEFTEPLDAHILQLFIDSTNPIITPIMKQEIHDKLLKNINYQTGELKVKHRQPYGLGRVYAENNISIVPFARVIKHTVFDYMGWRDIDMIKGHPSIACEMGKKVGLSFNAIERYVTSFPEVCEEMREFYQLDNDENALTDDDIKWFFNACIYGGGLDTWVKGLEEGSEEKGYKSKKLRNKGIRSPFADQFYTEAQKIMDRIYTKNPSLVRKFKKPEEKQYDTKKRVTHFWFGIIENHLLYTVYQHFIEQQLITPRRCGLEHDGLNLPRFLKAVDEDDLIADINTIIRLKTGLVVRMKFKDYPPASVLEDIIEQRRTITTPVVPVVVEECVGEYELWKRKFETECCKIKDGAIFIRRYIQNGHPKIVTHNKQSITTAYEHECFYRTDEKGKSKKVVFIHEWLSDPNMLCYDSAECVPPPLVCPPNIYNLWTPSPFEDMPIMSEDDPDYNEEAVRAFCAHVEILANHNQETYEYLMNWVAQSIQRPGEKMGVALNLVGAEGIGKNTFTEVLIELYGGRNKCLETTDPERDVWGAFNNLMIDAYLVVLSETDQRNSMGHDGKVKAIITDPVINISQKGKGTFPMNSYHRIIQNTNTEDPTKTSKGDRRNVIIRCSDEKKGDTEYFIGLNRVLYSPNALRSIYWTLKNTDISTFKRGDKIITEYHDEIISCNEDPLRLFMCWFVENSTEEIIEMSSVEFLRAFKTWRDQTGFKFGENMNVLSLIKRITLSLKAPKDAFYSRKGQMSNTRCIDIIKMREFLNI